MFQKSAALAAKDTTGGVGKTQMAIPDTLAIVLEWRATLKLWARTDFRRRGLEVRFEEARFWTISGLPTTRSEPVTACYFVADATLMLGLEFRRAGLPQHETHFICDQLMKLCL